MCYTALIYPRGVVRLKQAHGSNIRAGIFSGPAAKSGCILLTTHDVRACYEKQLGNTGAVLATVRAVLHVP
jgi:hypothetical protein